MCSSDLFLLFFTSSDASFEKKKRVSQAALAVFINDLEEQIFCVPNINPHSVSTPSSCKQRQIYCMILSVFSQHTTWRASILPPITLSLSLFFYSTLSSLTACCKHDKHQEKDFCLFSNIFRLILTQQSLA